MDPDCSRNTLRYRRVGVQGFRKYAVQCTYLNLNKAIKTQETFPKAPPDAKIFFCRLANDRTSFSFIELKNCGLWPNALHGASWGRFDESVSAVIYGNNFIN
jgi:hypothetical protein